MIIKVLYFFPLAYVQLNKQIQIFLKLRIFFFLIFFMWDTVIFFYQFALNRLMFCSCLIARNLLSGLKTCVEVSKYMHDWGASMPHGSITAPSSFMEDNNTKADMEYTVSNQCLFFACYFHFDLQLQGEEVVVALVRFRNRLNHHCHTS